VLPPNIQHDWLIFQILPPVDGEGVDSFLALITNCLIGVDDDLLAKLQAPYTPMKVLGSAFNSLRSSFFYVIDEAQVAGRRYTSAFSCVEGKNPRPVLRPIIRRLVRGPTVKLIVSGTGFSLDLFITVLTSGVGKKAEWTVVHGTGDFTNRGTQLEYVSRYLPPSFLTSQSGDHLKTRLYDWLRGR
jgi:hypothetical protein